MPFSRIFLGLLLGIAWGMGSVQADPGASLSARKPAARYYSEISEKVPVVVRSPNAIENPARLAFCEKALIQIAARLGVTHLKGCRFIVVWDEESPNSVWLDSFPRNLRPNGDKEWVFTIRGQGDWDKNTEQLYRSLAICFLQTRMLPEKGPLPEQLPEPPLWLSEGLTQSFMESRKEDFSSAVWRFSLGKKVPSLQEIQSWDELSEGGIRRSWQQTFMFWLFNQATRTSADKATLLVYLTSFLKDPEHPYWPADTFNEEWWQRSTALALKQAIPGYDWDQSLARLREITYFPVRYKEESEDRLISITELPKSVQAMQNVKSIEEARVKLADLQLTCHPLVKPVVAYYRGALESWLTGKIDAYAWNLRAARDQQKEATALREKAGDFLDWFTVNYAIKVPNRPDLEQTDYEDYAKRVEELENARRDFRQEHISKTTTIE